MKLRAVQFGFAVALGGALSGLGGAAEPAAAQSYLSDGSNSGSVTVDYSVLGQAGAGTPYGRTGLPGGTVGSCSCASAPLGVIATPPRPTFNSPYATPQAAQAPAVPPGFMPYSQAIASVGGGSSGGRIVLRPPSPQPSSAVAAAPAPSNESGGTEMEPMESAEDNTPSAPAITGSATASAPSLPVTTPTQSESQPAKSQPAPSTDNSTASSGGEAGAPPAPETMPSEVPSPVPPQVANAAPAAPAAGTENQAAAQPAPAPSPAAPTTETPAPAPENQETASTENQAQPEAAPAAPENQAAAENPPAPENQTAPATGNESGAAAENEQQAAVTPPAPEGGAAGNAGAQNPGLPAGAHRIIYSGDSDDVPAASTADLDAVAKAMLADENMRVQVLAYASGTEDEESKARRKSLARGLAVRSYLIKAGVRSTRIDVRALGSKADGGPADRVDVIPAS
jgi:outer membrane protein OmpA-like peptidoglycan-associated protein